MVLVLPPLPSYRGRGPLICVPLGVGRGGEVWLFDPSSLLLFLSSL